MNMRMQVAWAVVQGGRLLDQDDMVGEIVAAAAEVAGCSVRRTHSYQFPGGGVTAVSILAESHAIVHTWPEVPGYMMEASCCGDHDAWAIVRGVCCVLGGVIADSGRGVRGLGLDDDSNGQDGGE